PDGGYAWVIATCACVLTMATWGSNASYGVFLNYYLSSNYFPGATDFDYALIGGLVAAIALSLSPVVFVFVSYLGLKQTISLGIIIQTAGYILASFATKTWQLYMTQGVLVGVSFSLVFVSSISILPNWFFYKRALASGIMVSGAGTGGILFSLSSNKLMEQTGNHKWPLRMVGFVTLFMCVVCMLLLKQYPKTSPNHPKHPAHIPQPRPSLKKAFEVVFDFSIVELIPIHFITVWYMLCNVGYIILLFSMSAYSSSVGLTHQQGSNITAILNVGQCIGRPLMGYAADRVGRINFTIVVTFTVSLLIFTFWINAKTYAALCVFALVTGSIIGIGSVNNQPLALEVSGSARFPSAFSYMNIIVGITTMFAEVMALKLRNNNLSNPFLHCQIFTGVLYFGAFLIISPVREWKVKRLFSKRRDEIFGLLDRNGLIDGETVLTREEVELYKKRLHKYDILLSTEVSGYITRLVYPIKV
ncbi:MFS general substrate transporter, partial [Nadsonia fulvescens var. elongata DSM 6958]